MWSGEPRARRPLPARRVFSMLLGLAVLSAAAVTAAESPEELREKRKEVKAEAAAVAATVDALEDDAAAVTEALAALQESVDAQSAAVEAAKRAVLDAEAATAAARRAVDALEAEQAALRADLESAAVEAYVSFQAPVGGATAVTDDPWQQAREEALVDFATGIELDELDQLRTVAAELDAQRQLATEAEAEADFRRAEVDARLVELEDARDRQQAVVDDANTRLEARLAEAAALADLDADLSAQIQAEEARIAAEIATRQAASRPPSQVNVPANAPVDLVTVRGIVVNAAIADQTEGLLAALAADGFNLGGGGYRDSSRQISLRRSHCGTSDYAIWEMPASQCRPPTARPGRSDHERGLAIDFSYQGRTIRSRSSAAFQALAEHAPRFGFRNLPSEPWHWSAG